MAHQRTWLRSNAALLTLGFAAFLAHAPLPACAAASPGSPAQAADHRDPAIHDPADLTGEQVRPALGPDLPADQGAAGLALTLKKLATRASLLMIVAHPDDEDGGMLTYESRGLGARVADLSLTRGEGGQNLMSADFNDALGLVRTRELLAADRFFAIDQLFGTEVDFGFSKTIDEAFAQWTHQRVLYDAVRAVRLYRPLILTSVFVGAPSDGHGQHQVSGEIAQEVFTAAADPKVFPEMGLPPWAPARVYARVPFATIDSRGMFDYATSKYVPTRFTNYITGKVSTAAPKADITIPEGDPSPALGMSYLQFARQGLALQRSQIGGSVRLAPAGAFDVGYTLYGSRVPSPAKSGSPVNAPEQSFFEGIDTSLPGLATLAAHPPAFLTTQLQTIATLVAQAQTSAELHPHDLPAVAPLLRDGLLATNQLIAEISTSKDLTETERFNLLHELRIKRVQFNHALTLALRITLVARLTTPTPTTLGGVPVALTPGEPFSVHLNLDDNAPEPLTLVGCSLREVLQTATKWTAVLDVPGCSSGPTPLPPMLGTELAATVPTDARGQRPPFHRDSLEQPFYTVPDPALRNAPLAPAPLVLMAQIQYGKARIELAEIVSDLSSNVAQPATVIPPVNISLEPAVAVVPLADRTLKVDAAVEHREQPTGTLRLNLPPGWTTSPPTAPWQPQPTPFTITPTKLAGPAHDLLAIATLGPAQFSETFHAVGYPGLIRDVAYEPARTRVQGLALTLPPNLRVAYLPGTGDTVEAALRAMGIATTQITVADIAANHLANYDAVVLGVRAYAAHLDLPAATPQLLAFARAGGTVVAQYNTTEYTAADSPFPLSFGTNERVVEERDPVRLLDPTTQALSWPNKLTEHDFDGWIEERGHGFMGTWASEYIAPTEVHDPGEDPQRGGLLVAPVGQGHYVYCAFALYRQLPEGVPGAYRLLANLVSLSRHPR